MSQARQADIDLYIENGAATQRLLRPYYLMADKQKLGQVIRNLVSNGIKFSRAGGSIRVKLTAVSQDTSSNRDDKFKFFLFEYLWSAIRYVLSRGYDMEPRRNDIEMGTSLPNLPNVPGEDNKKLFLRLEVIDSGAGISKVHRDQLQHIILCVEITHSYL